MMHTTKDNMIGQEILNTMIANKTIQILDIRDLEDVKVNPLHNSRHIPMMTLVMFYDDLLDKNMTYYIHSEFGQRRTQVTKILQLNGYHVIELENELELVTA